MDWVIGHGEIAHPDAHAIADSRRQHFDAGEYARIPRPHVEVRHLGDIRQGSARRHVVGAHDEDVVEVDYKSAALLELELVDEGLAHRDVRLGKAAYAVHAVRHQHAVPMYRGVLRQLVGDEDADLVAFDRLDGGPRRLPVITP